MSDRTGTPPNGFATPASKRKVSARLAVGIVLAPILFAWFLLRKGYSTRARVLSFVWAGTYFIGAPLVFAPVVDQAQPVPVTSVKEPGAAAPRPHQAGDSKVSRTSFEAAGLTWPLNVESATIGCTRMARWVRVGGERYALNGTAGGQRIYSDIAPIWSVNETLTEAVRKAGGPSEPPIMKSLSDIIEEAGHLCRP